MIIEEPQQFESDLSYLRRKSYRCTAVFSLNNVCWRHEEYESPVPLMILQFNLTISPVFTSYRH